MSAGNQSLTTGGQQEPCGDDDPRKLALEAAGTVPIAATDRVAFHSDGRVLVVGPPDVALGLARTASLAQLAFCVLVPGSGQAGSTASESPVFYAKGREIRLQGHFGAFIVEVVDPAGVIDLATVLNTGQSHFDLVVDLGDRPLIDFEVLPLGYYRCHPQDQEALAVVIGELPEMVGDFDKPRYFQYDADICAHGRSGVRGCQRCLDSCPTGAITSLAESVRIDPYYCQGGGSCAAACPSGAISYRYPAPRDLLNRLRKLLRTFDEHGGGPAVLLFHGGGSDGTALESLPANVIPVEVEEIGSVGMDVWLACLAYGAARIVLLAPDSVPTSVRRETEAQLSVAHALLTGMGFPAAALALVAEAEASRPAPGDTMPALSPTGFAGSNAKRDTLFAAIDHLLSQSQCGATELPLPAASPFGSVVVNQQTCTLCMACVSVCPAAALGDGVDTPLLSFTERNCVQCGLCELACPEDAIERHPRLLTGREQRNKTQVLHQEPPFCCVVCGTPFATRSVIETLTERLRSHSMFQEPQALERLRMCGDCRVKDMFAADLRPGDGS